MHGRFIYSWNSLVFSVFKDSQKKTLTAKQNPLITNSKYFIEHDGRNLPLLPRHLPCLAEIEITRTLSLRKSKIW
jgi:hypothetical protein